MKINIHPFNHQNVIIRKCVIFRLLRLYEGRQYREAAGFLLRLPQYTLRSVLPDIPIDLLIETLPHSISLLEALYARMLELGVRDAKVLRLEQLLWKVVGLVSSVQDPFHLRAWARLLTALNRFVYVCIRLWSELIN